MNNIPYILVYSRIPIAIAIAFLLLFRISYAEVIVVTLLIIGLLTDVFDGIIARKLEISTEKLRVLDSNVDQFFWLSVIGAIFYTNPEFIKQNYHWVLVVVFFEILAYMMSYIRFRRTIATHSLLAKFWVITLLAFLVDLVLHSNSNWVFTVCLVLGIISRLEIIAIILLLKKWATDVPSIMVVSKVNRGIKVKKSSWFNS